MQLSSRGPAVAIGGNIDRSGVDECAVDWLQQFRKLKRAPAALDGDAPGAQPHAPAQFTATAIAKLLLPPTLGAAASGSAPALLLDLLPGLQVPVALHGRHLLLRFLLTSSSNHATMAQAQRRAITNCKLPLGLVLLLVVAAAASLITSTLAQGVYYTLV